MKVDARKLDGTQRKLDAHKVDALDLTPRDLTLYNLAYRSGNIHTHTHTHTHTQVHARKLERLLPRALRAGDVVGCYISLPALEGEPPPRIYPVPQVCWSTQ